MKKDDIELGIWLIIIIALLTILVWFIFREPEYELVSRTSSISIDGDVTEGVTLRDKLTGEEKDIYWEVEE